MLVAINSCNRKNILFPDRHNVVSTSRTTQCGLISLTASWLRWHQRCAPRMLETYSPAVRVEASAGSTGRNHRPLSCIVTAHRSYCQAREHPSLRCSSRGTEPSLAASVRHSWVCACWKRRPTSCVDSCRIAVCWYLPVATFCCLQKLIDCSW